MKPVILALSCVVLIAACGGKKEEKKKPEPDAKSVVAAMKDSIQAIKTIGDGDCAATAKALEGTLKKNAETYKVYAEYLAGQREKIQKEAEGDPKKALKSAALMLALVPKDLITTGGELQAALGKCIGDSKIVELQKLYKMMPE